MSANDMEMKKVNTVRKRYIKSRNFVFKGKKYPIDNLKHAKKSLIKVDRHGTPEEKMKVRSEAFKKYPSLKD